MSEPGFWDDQDNARTVSEKASHLKQMVTAQVAFKSEVEDLQTLLEMTTEEEGDDGALLLEELSATVAKLKSRLDELELASFLSEKFDGSNAILTINSGAGGTESCDWADMLLRMYTRWAERRGFKVELQDIQAGEEAGISRATIHIAGANAFGYAKAERGVHRLVRISPFDSNARRHTSFSSVDVVPEIKEDIDIEVKEEDLRIDTYRASGKGGQHVNTTDSAVRITHLPTGIVASCQNERSQIKNRATAMKMLKSKLYEKREDEKRSEQEKLYGEKGEIGWGNQIRSYVFQPYQMVKDLRTGIDTSNIQDVMDGDLDRFIHGWLRAGCPLKRSKDYLAEE